jgi:hypothetical protein
MGKRKSTRETKNMVQTALWLPRGMQEHLKKAGGERGLGDEIRRRIQITLDIESLRRDQTTRQLLDEIEQLALSSSLDKGSWHANRFAYDVFKAAINELLASYQPHSDAPGVVDRLKALYGPDEKPETIGRILARVFIAAREREREREAQGFED